MRKLKEYSRYFFCIFILLAVFIAYALRLADWQIVKGAHFLMTSDTSNTSTVKVDAARGEILDADGNGLAVNKTGYSIVFDKTYMTEGTENKTILQLTKLLAKRGETWVDELPITVDAKGKYSFVAGKDKDKEIAALKASDSLRLNSYATADQCMQAMIDLYKCSSYSPADIRTIVSVRYNMDKSYFSISNPYTFSENVSQDTVSIVRENSQLLPGATIKITTVRQYPNPTLIPHIIGTVGSLSLDDYNEFKKEGKIYSPTNVSGYAYNDHIGVGGIERALESTLRGKAGQKSIETTNTGALAQEKYNADPTSGNTVYLTINSRVQAVLNAALAQNIRAANAFGKSQGKPKSGEDCVRGGAVILNVKDFSVLAAATYPSYDMSQLDNASYYSSLLKDENKPLVNNAFNGVFMPGSAFKPMVAAAALQEGVITANTHFTCNRYYDRWTDYRPQCMGTHGSINVITALQVSCNIFFFETGFHLGITNLDLYGKRFGLGQKTGIEISESSGTLSGPEERKASGGTPWIDNSADVVQTSIGQSDNAFTPLQLATYVATIANNGVRLKTHLVSKVSDYSRKTVISQTKPTVMDNVEVSQANLNIVKTGMRACAESGTASSRFGNYGITTVAAKTGTAENPPHSDNETFIGFAPYDNPKIAVSVVLEHGAKSRYSLNVAKAAFDAFFNGYTADANGNIFDKDGKPVTYNFNY